MKKSSSWKSNALAFGTFRRCSPSNKPRGAQRATLSPWFLETTTSSGFVSSMQLDLSWKSSFLETKTG